MVLLSYYNSTDVRDSIHTAYTFLYCKCKICSIIAFYMEMCKIDTKVVL